MEPAEDNLRERGFNKGNELQNREARACTEIDPAYKVTSA